MTELLKSVSTVNVVILVLQNLNIKSSHMQIGKLLIVKVHLAAVNIINTSTQVHSFVFWQTLKLVLEKVIFF